MPNTTKTLHWPGSIRALAGESLYVQIVSRTTGDVVNAAEETLSEAANGHRSASVSIDDALSGWYAVYAWYASDDVFAASGFVNITASSSLIVKEDVSVEEVSDGEGSAVGSGAIRHTDTIYKPDGESPLSTAKVWITTDEAGENVVAGTRTTDDFGEVYFMLDAGTYYRWVDHPEFEFDNPQEFEVTE